MINARSAILSGAILGCLAVLIGAFGAHGLKDYLAEVNRAADYETAVRYQFYHAIALVLTGILMMHATRSTWLKVASICFLLGTVIFSGMLYALVFSGITWLGAIVPIGGVLLVVGWIALGVSTRELER
ncbi:MAG: DUF423 domain-containing protein [Planctomycetota bacterium]|nr:DUF423 domain-containing protein [Planctomycetota bacterium]